MSIKKLKYPAGDNLQSPESGSINNRLDIAHTHENKFILDNIDETTIEEIKKIKDKLNKNLDGIDLVALKQAAIDAGVAFNPPNDNNVIYGIKGGKFVSISDDITPIEYTSSTLDITSSHTIDIPQDIMDMIGSIENKMDKITGVSGTGYLLTNSANGNAQASSIKLADLLQKSSVTSDILEKSTDSIPNSAATYKLYEMLHKAISEGGTLLPPVVHTYNRGEPGYKILKVKIEAGGVGYNTGSFVYHSIPTALIPASLIVKEVDAYGSVGDFDIDDGGFYSLDPRDDKMYTVTSASGRDAQIKVTEVTHAYSSVLPNVDNVNENDICCVLEDEQYENNQSFYVLKVVKNDDDSETRNWVHVCSFPRSARDFIKNPITTAEIENNVVVNSKMAEMPPLTVKANINTEYAAPSDVNIDDLLNSASIVQSIKYQGELDSARRSGHVELQIDKFKLKGFTRDISNYSNLSSLILNSNIDPISAFQKLQAQSDYFYKSGIGSSTSNLTSISDCNEAKTFGLYQVLSSTANTPIPPGNTGKLLVIPGLMQLIRMELQNNSGISHLTGNAYLFVRFWRGDQRWDTWRSCDRLSLIDDYYGEVDLNNLGEGNFSILCMYSKITNHYPVINDCIVLQYYFAGIGVQIAFDLIDNEMYHRSKDSIWSDWKKVGELPEPLQIIADAGVTNNGSIHYPRSITPPASYNDNTIATTEYTHNAILNEILPLSAALSSIQAKLNLNSGNSSDFPFLTAGTYTVSLYPGLWQIECWGAQGGGTIYKTVDGEELEDTTKSGGHGGYARTTILVTSNVDVYAVVGSQPSDYNGGFNGGGSSAAYSGLGGNCIGYGGGGATHVALVDGMLSTLSDFKSQVILVAGGGGGSYAGTNTSGNIFASDSAILSAAAQGGAGGGLEGQGGAWNSSGGHGGWGGTQTEGGSRGLPYNSEANKSKGESMYNPTSGDFGIGGNGNKVSAPGYSPNHGGAGGGGWYGGGGGSPVYSYHNGYHTNSCYAGGGGGSGYIAYDVFTLEEFQNDAPEIERKIQVEIAPTRRNNPYTSTFTFDSATNEITTNNVAIQQALLQGTQLMPSSKKYSGTDSSIRFNPPEVGNSGNGKVRFTYLKQIAQPITSDQLRTTSVSSNSFTMYNGGDSTSPWEFACSYSQQQPTSGWQSSPTFTGLSTSGTHYVFVRKASTSRYHHSVSKCMQVILSSRSDLYIKICSELSSSAVQSLDTKGISWSELKNNGEPGEYGVGYSIIGDICKISGNLPVSSADAVLFRETASNGDDEGYNTQYLLYDNGDVYVRSRQIWDYLTGGFAGTWESWERSEDASIFDYKEV